MDITVEGRGTFNLSLESGNLVISKDNQTILETKGNPTKLGNPAFETVEEGLSYFNTLIISQPLLLENQEEEEVN